MECHSFTVIVVYVRLSCRITRAGNSLIGFPIRSKKWAIHSFAQKNEWFTHSLISSEQPERIAHGPSFVLSDLNNSLRVAHFLWATWAIRSFDLSEMSQWAMSKLANSQPCALLFSFGKSCYWQCYSCINRWTIVDFNDFKKMKIQLM